MAEFDATADFLAREQAAMQQIGENIDDFGAFDSSPTGNPIEFGNNNEIGTNNDVIGGLASNIAHSDNYSNMAAPSSSSPQSIGKSSSVGAFEIVDSEAVR